jgi:hypothetical protein
MSSKIAEIIKNVQSEYGESVFLPHRRAQFNALLRDYLKNSATRDEYLIMESLKLGIWQRLRKNSSNIVKAQNVCFTLLTDDYCMTEEGARYIIELWSDVIKAGSEMGVPRTIDRKKSHQFRGLKEVVLPYGVKVIGKEAFADCSALKRIILPESVVTIAKGAFCLCRSLEEVVIPRSVKQIGPAAFWGCTKLDMVVLPAGVDHIGSYAFDDCSKELVVQCGRGTYAAKYCKEHGLRVMEVKFRQAN